MSTLISISRFRSVSGTSSKKEVSPTSPAGGCSSFNASVIFSDIAFRTSRRARLLNPFPRIVPEESSPKNLERCSLAFVESRASRVSCSSTTRSARTSVRQPSSPANTEPRIELKIVSSSCDIASSTAEKCSVTGRGPAPELRAYASRLSAVSRAARAGCARIASSVSCSQHAKRLRSSSSRSRRAAAACAGSARIASESATVLAKLVRITARSLMTSW